MDADLKARCLAVLEEIQLDLERDVAKHDGQPITGNRLAVMHAELSAVVAGLTAVVQKIVEES